MNNADGKMPKVVDVFHLLTLRDTDDLKPLLILFEEDDPSD